MSTIQVDLIASVIGAIVSIAVFSALNYFAGLTSNPIYAGLGYFVGSFTVARIIAYVRR